MLKEHYEHLVSQIQKLDSAIEELAKPFEPTINLLCTNPGIKHHSAITILSEIGTDMSQFGCSKRLCRWAGLTPGNNKSAGEVWNPTGLNQIDMTPELREKELQKSLRRAAKLLIAHGLITSEAIRIPDTASA